MATQQANAESARGVGINGDVAGTLDASHYKGCGMRQGVERDVVAMPQLYENHSQDSRYTGPHEVAPTTNAKYGTGGNNQPLVVLPIHDKATRHAGKRGEKHDGAGNGLGVGADGDPMYTLMGSDHHAVAYEVIPINTMVATRGGADDGRTTFGKGEPGEPQFTLQAAHGHAVAYGIDRAAFNQGENAKYEPKIEEEISATIVARGPNAVAMCVDVGWLNSFEEQSPSPLARQYKDPPLVSYWDGGQVAGTLTANNANGAQRMPDKEHFNCVIEEDNMEQKYIVRRLTPLECCRLQGFPDGWGETDDKTDFTDEEFRFWHEVRNTHGRINGKAVRHYTKAQMVTWYNKLHTDSAEYKMWGNGIALPCARYVMQGIVDAVKEDEENV